MFCRFIPLSNFTLSAFNILVYRRDFAGLRSQCAQHANPPPDQRRPGKPTQRDGIDRAGKLRLRRLPLESRHRGGPNIRRFPATGRSFLYHSAMTVVHWSIDYWIDQSIACLIIPSIDCLIGWPWIDWLLYVFIHSSIDGLIDWFTPEWTGQLIDWLIARILPASKPTKARWPVSASTPRGNASPHPLSKAPVSACSTAWTAGNSMTFVAATRKCGSRHCHSASTAATCRPPATPRPFTCSNSTTWSVERPKVVDFWRVWKRRGDFGVRKSAPLSRWPIRGTGKRRCPDFWVLCQRQPVWSIWCWLHRLARWISISWTRGPVGVAPWRRWHSITIYGKSSCRLKFGNSKKQSKISSSIILFIVIVKSH